MAGKKIVDEAKEAASAVTKKTKAAVTKKATKGAKAVKEVAAKGADAAKVATKAASGAATKAKKSAKGALGAAAEVIGKVKDKAVDVAGDVVDGAKDIAENATETAGKVTAKVKKGTKAAAAKAAETVKDVAEDAGVVATKVTKEVKEVAENVVEGAKDLAHDAAEKVGDVAEDVGAAAAGLVAEGKKGGGVLVPLLLIVAVGGLGWYGWTKGNVKTVNPAVTAEVNAEQPAWFGGIVDGLKEKFPWLSLKLNGTSLIASGEAADKNAKDAALADLSMSLETSDGKGTLVIDDIKVAGSQEAPIGAALATLGEKPDAATCTKAFSDTMAGRTINFATGAATVNSDSASLLDVLTAIATACKAHKIEVAGHTDARGNADANLKLSQSRADAVKAFWVQKGVPAEGLTAKGYGATKPLDPSATEEAYAKNRRTEFTVTD